MFGAVPLELLIDVMRKDGYMYQMPLPLDTPAEFTLPEHYFESIPMGFTSMNTDSNVPSSDMSTIDHPAFTRLRDRLENEGYIKTERNGSNGDRVLKRFKLNDHWFEEGEQFPCASAMRGVLKLPWMSNLRYKTDYEGSVEMVLSNYEFQKLVDMFDRDMVDINKIEDGDNVHWEIIKK